MIALFDDTSGQRVSRDRWSGPHPSVARFLQWLHASKSCRPRRSQGFKLRQPSASLIPPKLGRDVKNLLDYSVFLGEFLRKRRWTCCSHDLAAASSTSLPCRRADGRRPTLGAPVVILPWAGTLCRRCHCQSRGLDQVPAGFASLAEPGREGPYISPAENKQWFIDRGSTFLGRWDSGTGPKYGVLTCRRCVATLQHSIKAHGSLFVTPFPSFRPTKLAMRVCPRTFGGRIFAGRCALLGHYQNDCLCAISPTQILQDRPRTSLTMGKSQSHVSTDFPP